jgi:hypothetical protein
MGIIRTLTDAAEAAQDADGQLCSCINAALPLEPPSACLSV